MQTRREGTASGRRPVLGGVLARTRVDSAALAGGRAVEYVLGEYSRVLPGPLGNWSAMAAAARPRGRAVALPSCAGVYVSGAAGSNACPAGSARIKTEAACRTAAAAAGKTFNRVHTSADSPRGCYYFTVDNYAYLNTHAVGAGFSAVGTVVGGVTVVEAYQLLCAALVTTGAPLHAPMRRRACAARYSRAVCLIMQTA
jgi:hypothetical protein